MIKTTYLQAAVPLTKTFTMEGGELKKSSHPRIIDVTSHFEEFETIEEFYEQLKIHAAQGHSFLKGNVNRPLQAESRAGTTNPTDPTSVLLLDIDGLRGAARVVDLLRALGLDDVDHIIQFSSSMGIVKDRGLSAHVFLLLSRMWAAAMLKQWLIAQNINIPMLRNNLALTRTNNALRWGLDVTTCQNDKLIYIAPPIVGKNVDNQFQGERIQLVKGAKRTADLTGAVPSVEANRIEVEKAINELRIKFGLPARKKVSSKILHNVEYQAAPDQAAVTDIKIERGFVYLNINGGDSWAYYHPENNPEFIYNFKSEPTYKTSELLPEYWSEVREQQNIPTPDAKGTLYLAVRDFGTAAYYNGTWNEKERILNLKPAKSKDQLHDFLLNNKQKIPMAIPDWEIGFEPTCDVVIDIEAKKINTFVASQYMAMTHRAVHQVPKTIHKIIFNALGSNEEIYDHFMNSLACIYQYRMKTQSAWILQGVVGTGKGLLINSILRPIYGMQYVAIIRMRDLDSQFNQYMANNLILWVDEAEFRVMDNQAIIGADLRNYITEPYINVRKMYTPSQLTKNHTTIIMVGNDNVMVQIPRGDRRFNVAPYQTTSLASLGSTNGILDDIGRELTDFAAYLATFKADQDRARIPLANAAKELLVAENETSIDQVCGALRRGDFRFFWDLAPKLHLQPGAAHNTGRDGLAGSYIAILQAIIKGERKALIREEIQTMLEYVIGSMPTASHKFTSLIKHHKIVLETVTRDGRSMKGLRINWVITDDDRKEVAK